MFAKTLTALSTHLDGYLRRAFRLNEEIVSLQPPAGSASALAADNKVHLFLANVERETAGGIAFNRQATSGAHFQLSLPAWQLNVYVMIAAVFSEKQYDEALKLLSGAAAFVQANNQLSLPGTSELLYVEPVNLSFGELSNLWSIYGNQYYPSLLCKLRNVAIDSSEIREIGSVVKNTSYELK